MQRSFIFDQSAHNNNIWLLAINVCSKLQKMKWPIYFGCTHSNFRYNEIMMNFSILISKRPTFFININETNTKKKYWKREKHGWNMNINYLSIPILMAFLYPLSNSTCSIYLLLPMLSSTLLNILWLNLSKSKITKWIWKSNNYIMHTCMTKKMWSDKRAHIDFSAPI